MTKSKYQTLQNILTEKLGNLSLAYAVKVPIKDDEKILLTVSSPPKLLFEVELSQEEQTWLLSIVAEADQEDRSLLGIMVNDVMRQLSDTDLSLFGSEEEVAKTGIAVFTSEQFDESVMVAIIGVMAEYLICIRDPLPHARYQSLKRTKAIINSTSIQTDRTNNLWQSVRPPSPSRDNLDEHWK